MPSLWFCVPVHGRLPLASICLRQLRHTCDALIDEGIDATAVVIADAENLEQLPDLGFATVERDNSFLSSRFNDGFQLAFDERFNPRPADYVVPCGSDDWVDYRLFLDLPPNDTVVGFQHMGFVREDGSKISAVFLSYLGGSGIRIYPREVMAELDFRPADEDRKRACDTSTLYNLHHKLAGRFKVEHRHLHNFQIVDWKSPDQQLNTFNDVAARYKEVESGDPFELLAGIYPDESLAEMQRHYDRELVAA